MTDPRPAYERSHPTAIAEIEKLRAFVKEIAALKHDSDGFDAEASLINIKAMAARTLGLEQKAGES